MILETEEKIYKEQGKKWRMRKVFCFGQIIENGTMRPNNCEYDVLGYRNPKAGEWFLSGARPSAYKASQDLLQPMLVVKPTIRRKLRNIQVYI